MQDTEEIAESLRQYDEEVGFTIIDLVDAVETEGGPEFLGAVADFRAAQARDAVYGYRIGTDEAEAEFVAEVRAIVEGRDQ